MDSLPFLHCLNLTSISSSSLNYNLQSDHLDTRSHSPTSNSIMGGCASKPKESDDGPARGSPLSSDNPQVEAGTAQSTTNGGESQIENPEHEAEKEVQTSSTCETVSAVTEVPKMEDEVESTNKNNEDKVEAAVEQPVKEAEAAEKTPDIVPPNKEEDKSNAPVASL